MYTINLGQVFLNDIKKNNLKILIIIKVIA